MPSDFPPCRSHSLMEVNLSSMVKETSSPGNEPSQNPSFRALSTVFFLSSKGESVPQDKNPRNCTQQNLRFQDDLTLHYFRGFHDVPLPILLFTVVIHVANQLTAYIIWRQSLHKITFLDLMVRESIHVVKHDLNLVFVTFFLVFWIRFNRITDSGARSWKLPIYVCQESWDAVE